MTTKTPSLDMSSLLLLQEAEKRGIICTEFGDRQTVHMRSQEHQWYIRGSRTSLQSSVGRTIADLKHLTKRVLSHHNLPTARFVEASKPSDLEKLSQLQFPIVMKPKQGKHGSGVVVGITDAAQAELSFSQANSSVIFEEMLQGIEFRIVCIDFKFVAAAFRKPAHVTGDGAHSIQELITVKNQHPWRGTGHGSPLSTIVIDAAMQTYLAEQTYTLESVPEANQEVYLRKTANLSTGGEAWDVTASVCAENIALFEQISRACDLNTIGIDMMCQSLTEPIITQKNAGVIEVNASPGLRMHHYPLQGDAINVAGLILDMLERRKDVLQTV